jgi:hypothetical protein
MATTGQEQLITLSYSQLQQIIEKAVLEATEPLYREIAFDRKRIAKLEQSEPQPIQKDRGEILRALLAANGGKMLAKEARHKMHLSESRFSELLSKMENYIEKRSYHLYRTQNIIILK